jgi:hypothetical protein
MRARLVTWFRRSIWLQLMGLSACLVSFGLLTMNLYHVTSANLSFINEAGLMAFSEGAAEQLAGIAIQAVAATLSYAGLKVFEKMIIEWWLGDWH